MADVPAIQDCARQAYAKYVDRIGREPAPMIADFDALTAQDKVHVAAAEDSIHGYIVFYPRGNRMHLENVAVTTQGRGVGRKLIEHCEATARKMGFDSVELYTNEKMTENLMLYPKLGYEEIDRRTEDGFNRVYFEKLLS